jgi:hypothetical protein
MQTEFEKQYIMQKSAKQMLFADVCGAIALVISCHSAFSGVAQDFRR